MLVNVSVEFGYELAVVVPHAYHAHLNGNLKRTISCGDTSVFYPFSSNHIEMYHERTSKNNGDSFPNHDISVKLFNTSLWTPPPLKKIYTNSLLTFEKPLLVIANKFAIEFGKEPYNYIDASTLDTLFSLLKHKYQIVYCRYKGEGINDESWRSKPRTALDDGAVILKHPEVITLQTLHKAHPELTFNRLQVMLYANCDNFISISGGTTIFLCYFAKEILMYVKSCRDVTKGCTKGWYSQLYGTNVIDINEPNTLIKLAKEKYL